MCKRTTKCVVMLILCLSLQSLALSVEFAGGTGEPIPTPTIDWLAGAGTPEDPYKIETVDQLKLIGTANVLWDKHFVLNADLDCSSEEFDRIGVCPGTGFNGVFDGANHRLMNLTLGSDVPR